jgi:hypothetical protein
LEGLLPVLIVKSAWRKTNTPPSPTISPNTSNKSFEIAILFDVVERSGNYVFEKDIPPRALRARVLSCLLGACKVFIESVIAKTSKRDHSIGNWKDQCPF